MQTRIVRITSNKEYTPLGACHGSELSERGQVGDTIRRW
jgi:hypothetical protein